MAQPALAVKNQYEGAPPPSQEWETSFTSWAAEGGKPKAAVLSVHGFGLHKGAFDGFARRLARQRFATYAIDVRGFGSWQQTPRGKTAELDFYQTLMDVRMALLWIKAMHPGVPVFLLGESMGGAVALQATALFPESVNGLITSVPGDDYYGEGKTRLEVALHMMRPNKSLNLSKSIVEKATSNSKLQDTWLKDPKARLSLTPRQMAQFASFMKKSHDLAKTIDKTPVLMFQGARDRLSKADGTMRLFNELSTGNKDLVVLGDSEHLIFERGQFDEHIIEVVTSWMDKQAERSSAAATTAPNL